MVYICSAYAMTRSDKQPDRVEISPEQLSAAAIEAEVNICCVLMTISTLIASSHKIEASYSSIGLVS